METILRLLNSTLMQRQNEWLTRSGTDGSMGMGVGASMSDYVSI